MPLLVAKLCPDCDLLLEAASFYTRGAWLHAHCKPCAIKRATRIFKAKGIHEVPVTHVAARLCASIAMRPRCRLSRLEVKREIVRLWELQGGLCYYTGRPMTRIVGDGIVPTNVSVDRINPQGFYEVGNLVLCQNQINRLKTDLSVDELKEACRDILATLEKRA